MADVSGIRQRLEALEQRITAACEAAGRERDGVRLVGITKTHGPGHAREAVRLGVTDLGENRVAELVAKHDRVAGARWHYVGRLQSNKARDVVGRVALIHSVDRGSLIDEIDKRAEEPQPVLLQVNVGDDPRKGGCDPDDLPALVAYAQARPSVAVHGLMTMPPRPDDDADPAEAARPHFARLRELRDAVGGDAPQLTELSMGMTADLEAAIAEGATLVRVGTGLFGPRGPRPWQPIEGPS